MNDFKQLKCVNLNNYEYIPQYSRFIITYSCGIIEIKTNGQRLSELMKVISKLELKPRAKASFGMYSIYALLRPISSFFTCLSLSNNQNFERKFGEKREQRPSGLKRGE